MAYSNGEWQFFFHAISIDLLYICNFGLQHVKFKYAMNR
jgi:hypothetical protein